MDDFIYLYGLIPTKEAANQSFPSLTGFDGASNIYTFTIEKITAIVCNLDSNIYSEERVKDQINNDMEWLQEKAFHHHETVMKLSKMFTVLPLKFCTLYKNIASLKTAVRLNQSKIMDTFLLIYGNEEWNLKIYCEDDILKNRVSQSNPVIEAKRAEISQLPKGRQFFEKKKFDKLVEAQLEKEKNKISEQIHSFLSEFALKANVKENLSHQVTGKQEQMAWNGVYLVSKSKVEPFLEKIQQFEKDMRETGWWFKATGPWPAYHFSSFS
ncbi:GvpL/GvpF family gas vesicle protein [Neobacillus vireti]|uniref:GvpL/GvpF family gas vesicle protein n=1 Tax=Neobacillus vireti TaxID=220686 RepID=UPI003000C35C